MSLVRAQTMWALATSNGGFILFDFIFCFTLLEYTYLFIYLSPRMAEKNPNPKFRTITFMTFTL